MPAFTKEALSPRRVPSVVVPLPFDLTWSELDSALPTGAGSDRVATRRLELQGLRGMDRSTLLSVECDSAVVDVFVKLATKPERDRHVFLERARVPVPRLLAEVDRKNDQVVLVFECLDTIGVDIGDPTEVGELLQLLAQLNSVRVGAELPPLPKGRPEAEFTESVRRALCIVVERGLRPDLDVARWMAAYANSKEHSGSMARALTHGEFYFQQVGRRDLGPLVVFDLATVGLRRRFSDLCSVLGPVAAGMGETETATFGRYLELLQELGAEVPDAAHGFVECRWLRVLGGFQSLPWLTASYDDPDIGQAHLDSRLVTLERDLVDLDELR